MALPTVVNNAGYLAEAKPSFDIISAPAEKWVKVTKADSNLSGGVCRALLVGTAAALTDINRICNAMGLGTSYIGRKLCAIDPQADHTTPATHYLVNDMSAQVDEDPIWQGMANEADLPPIAGIWGEGGVISAQDAQAALVLGNIQVYTAAGMDLDNNPSAAIQWRNGILLGAGLQFVPDEPI